MAASDEGSNGLPRTASLHGVECPFVGAVSAVAEANAAIALSLGGAAKRYEHTHPNEDAVAFALGEGGVLLAIADGHTGRDAADLAIDTLIAREGARLTSAALRDLRGAWQANATRIFAELQQAILAGVIHGALDTARTTFALALLRPADDLLAFASMGDSHVFHVGSEVVDLAEPRSAVPFLGNPAELPESIIEQCVVGVETLAGTRAVILATDGLSEHGIGVDLPEATVGQCADRAAESSPELRALEAARGVAEASLAAHQKHRSGDNIAVAAAWVDPAPGSVA